jgi:TrkA-N domain.
MSGHLVLCNWSPRALDWIREVHSDIVTEKRPVVIVHDTPDEVVLPDKQDEAAFNDVYIVKGDPANEVVLRRAKVTQAHTVAILSDDREHQHADGKTIVCCIAIKNVCVQSASQTSWPSARIRNTGRTCVRRAPMKSSRPPTSDCG